MASRILGMGDILSLIEKAQESIDLDKAKELEQKIKKQDLDFEDFLEQMEQIQNMGPLDKILGMIPGMGNIKDQLGDVDLRKRNEENKSNCSIYDNRGKKRPKYIKCF